jgi:predicted alpha/beta superfamily hydrolase
LLTGDVRKFPDRRLIVYVPPGYENERERRYPVLYLQDGQNVFDGETAYVHGQEWFVDETAEHLIAAREIEPLIVVAIDNSGERRIDEYTPTVDQSLQRGGKADEYLDFLIADVKSFIDDEFRTSRMAEDTAIGGSSLGGLLALYAGLRHPAVFGKLAIMSPSVWWDNAVILRRVEEMGRATSQLIWLDIGTDEGGVVEDVRKLQGLLAVHYRGLKYMEAQGAGHNEHAWAERVGPMLRYLFPAEREVTSSQVSSGD